MRNLITIKDSEPAGLAEKTFQLFIKLVRDHLSSSQNVVVSIPGGSSVQPFFKKIGEQGGDRLARSEWERVHFFWTDERIVGPDSDESNYRLARDLFLEELLTEVSLPPDNVHRFPAESKDVGVAVEEYTGELNSLSSGTIHIPVLGTGEDGHIGSLFPGHRLLDSRNDGYLFVDDSPKPPPERITISPSLVRRSLSPLIFFIGQVKKDAYRAFLDQDTDYHSAPCKLALDGNPGDTCYVITGLDIPGS